MRASVQAHVQQVRLQLHVQLLQQQVRLQQARLQQLALHVQQAA